MAVVAPEGGSTRKRRRSSSTRQTSEALSTLGPAITPPPPVPQIDLPPLPNLPAPQPVRVEDPVAMLARAVAGLPGLPTINTLQTLASLAESTATNLLQSRLQAQEQALQQALGLGELALSRARLGLEQAQMAQDAWYRSQQLRQEEARRRFEEEQLRAEMDDERRQLALGAILDAINSGTSEADSRLRIETIFSVYPELRALVPQPQIEALLRARWGEPESDTGGGGGSGSWAGAWMRQNIRSLPQSLSRDIRRGGELLSNLLHRLSFDYVMRGR